MFLLAKSFFDHLWLKSVLFNFLYINDSTSVLYLLVYFVLCVSHKHYCSWGWSLGHFIHLIVFPKKASAYWLFHGHTEHGIYSLVHVFLPSFVCNTPYPHCLLLSSQRCDHFYEFRDVYWDEESEPQEVVKVKRLHQLRAFSSRKFLPT